MSKTSFNVTIRRDPEDARYWLVNVVDEPGEHTFGRSLSEAKRNGVEVVALWYELDPEALEIVWDIELGPLAKVVEDARSAMVHAAQDQRRRDDAVRAMTDAGLSYRDIGELLGLSFQRVAQISKAAS